MTVLSPLLLGGLDDGAFGLLPVFVRSDVFLLVVGITQRNLCRIVVELERFENIEHDVDHFFELFEQLVGAYEHVGVVLREAAHTGQAVQLARLLVAIHRAELRQAHRQLLVGAGLRAVDFAVMGAVHRLEQILFALDRGVDRLERVLAVFGVVAGGHVQFLIADVGRDDLLVAVLLLYAAQELFQAVAQGSAFGKPQG